MKLSLSIACKLAFAAGIAHATPVLQQVTNSSINATQILQLALTLEHLENTFYNQGLANLNESAFEQAGYAPWVRGRFEQIAEHEASHVALLTETLGNNSVTPCNYSFPYTNPQSFAALANLFENVGISAYLGGLQYLVNDTDALGIASSILSVEARQASWISSSVLLRQPWSGPYDTPLDGNMAYTLVSPFITQCPASNVTLPFMPFPNFNITKTGTNTGSFGPGDSVTLSYSNSTAFNNTYLVFLSGLNSTYANITDSQTTIPSDLQGLVYAVVSANNTIVSDSVVVAGPLMLDFNVSVSNS